jgi:hypothetical protein
MALENERGVSKKPAFLAAYVKTASVSKAARAAKIERSLHYRWLREDTEYAAAFATARLEAGELLEDEAVRRAYEGFAEPVVYQGGLCYTPDQYERDADTGATVLKKGAKPLTVRKYDAGLLMKLMDGFLPERYKRRSNVEVTGKNGEAIKLQAETLAKLSDEELKALLAIAAKLDPESENEAA